MLCRVDSHPRLECRKILRLWSPGATAPVGFVGDRRPKQPRDRSTAKEVSASPIYLPQTAIEAALDRTAAAAVAKYVDQVKAPSSPYITPRLLFGTAKSMTMTSSASKHAHVRPRCTTINLPGGSTTQETGGSSAKHPTHISPDELDTLLVLTIRDTPLAGARIATAHNVLLQESRLYIVKNLLSAPRPTQIQVTDTVRDGAYVMGTHHNAASVQFGRNTAANQLLHRIFNHVSDPPIRELRRANPTDTASLTTTNALLQAPTLYCGPCHFGKTSRSVSATD